MYFTLLALSFFCSAYLLVRNLHIFQLNSYKNHTQLKWLGENNPFSLFLPRKAKKPLVFTVRALRILGTALILEAVFYAVVTYFTTRAFGLVLSLAGIAVAPYIIVLANIILTPVEKSIQNYYINDARRILNSCPNLIVIGITGSYGKTSMKFYLSTLLKVKYNVLATPESYNTTMGVVRTIREHLRATTEVFICEMGARQGGDIKEICDIVKPKYGVITSIGPQHLETFKSIENIIKTKFELADAIPKDGMVFLNGDNAYIREHLPPNRITYGLSQDNDYCAYDVKTSAQGSSFVLCDKEGAKSDMQTDLIGTHNVLNITGALAVCKYLGVSDAELRNQAKRIPPVAHRQELKRMPQYTIIDDAYNSNPEGARAALETLSLFEGTKILVTPGMVELGEKHYECNKAFGEQAASVCDYVVLVGKNRTKPIQEGLLDAGFDKERMFLTEDIHEALRIVNGLKTPNEKIVLLENDLPDNY